MSDCRVLDLADEKGMFCGKVFADLGADVIKIERPAGDSTRSIGPFYHNIADPEKSLFWFFHNAGKRGITLNLEAERGRQLFRRLVEKADVLIETFPPGYLDSLGLGYRHLEEVNPGLVMVSITLFGQTGPYKDYQGDDLIAMAMGGYMQFTGEPDRPPLRTMVPQSYIHAGAHAAGSAQIALYWRHQSGRGQHLDVSLVEAVARTFLLEFPYWEMERQIVKRLSPYIWRASLKVRELWPCKDGYVGYRTILGAYARTVREVARLMKEEGLSTGPFEGVEDWEKLDYSKMDPGAMEEWERLVGIYFARHTKEELFRKALERGFYLAPSYNVGEIAEFEQLHARGFWAGIRHDELGDTIRYPSALVKSSEISWEVKRRAPLIGEHNEQLYITELGLSRRELERLKKEGAI